ncbi:MAG: Holliday junction resolvase RuvX [Candidatus Auribacterota bacterium]|jgi:putative Holliday junction resolvase|nr:Holliday junction resolvase RuvX [Candidatus Auribacterota bacterium]
MPRYLGIDYGQKRVGLAMSDKQGIISQVFGTLDNTSEKDVILKLIEIVKEYEVAEIIIGLPKNMNNTLGEKAKELLAFVDLMRDYIITPIHLWDERLTTREAERMLIDADISRKKRKKVVDSIASQLILQGYLDRKNRS